MKKNIPSCTTVREYAHSLTHVRPECSNHISISQLIIIYTIEIFFVNVLTIATSLKCQLIKSVN